MKLHEIQNDGIQKINERMLELLIDYSLFMKGAGKYRKGNERIRIKENAAKMKMYIKK